VFEEKFKSAEEKYCAYILRDGQRYSKMY